MNYVDACARLSDCEQHRIVLFRVWDDLKPMLTFWMLNPSTADSKEDDPTIRRCVGFAKLWGYGSIRVVNEWSYRATHPRDLKAAGYPDHLDSQLLKAEIYDGEEPFVLAWGANGPSLETWLSKRDTLPANAYVIGALTSGGCPAHPLMLSYSRHLVRVG